MTTDLMLAVAAQLASCTAAVWVLTELLGRATGWTKTYLALALGPILALAAYGTGFLTALPDCPFGGPACRWATAGFAGLITTLLAKGFHELIGDRVLSLLPGSGGPTPPSGNTPP
jgi:hypothetical protein